MIPPILVPVVTFAAAFLTGLLAGIYVCALIHDRRVRDLDGPTYAAMHRMRDTTFRVVMPPFALATLALLIAAAILARGTPAWLFAAAALILVADIAHTIRHQRPLNDRVQSWDTSALPADWASVRDAWARGHGLRVLAGLAVFTLTLLAAAGGGRVTVHPAAPA